MELYSQHNSYLYDEFESYSINQSFKMHPDTHTHNMYSKAIRIFREEGLLNLIRKGCQVVWNTYISEVFPRQTVYYNGIKIKKNRNFNSIISWSQTEEGRTSYESGTITAIDEWVKQGDEVIIIGGGWGVTATKAAKKVGSGGNVSVFEGATTEVSKVIQTAKLNGVYQTVTVNHAIVGPKISLRGDEGDAGYLSPSRLSDCDILELDCEGSEIEILENINIHPRVIIVESHGYKGSPSSKIADILENNGYHIQTKKVADKGFEEICEKKDIYVLTAVSDQIPKKQL